MDIAVVVLATSVIESDSVCGLLAHRPHRLCGTFALYSRQPRL